MFLHLHHPLKWRRLLVLRMEVTSHPHHQRIRNLHLLFFGTSNRKACLLLWIESPCQFQIAVMARAANPQRVLQPIQVPQIIDLQPSFLRLVYLTKEKRNATHLPVPQERFQPFRATFQRRQWVAKLSAVLFPIMVRIQYLLFSSCSTCSMSSAATIELSPVKDRAHGKPILVHPRMSPILHRTPTTSSVASGYAWNLNQMSCHISHFSIEPTQYYRLILSSISSSFLNQSLPDSISPRIALVLFSNAESLSTKWWHGKRSVRCAMFSTPWRVYIFFAGPFEFSIVNNEPFFE